MKKRIVAAFLSAILLLCLLLPLAGGVDLDHIYFMAVNETLYPQTTLSDDNMPVMSGGVLYVPYTILDAGYTGISLGIYYNYRRELDSFTIYDRQLMLTFGISDGTCKDRDSEYSSRVIARNGKIYIPISFVCDFFGLAYSTFSVTLPAGVVNMVRVCNDQVSLTDYQFATSATYFMSKPLNDYLRSKVTPTPTITAPTVSLPPTAPPTPPPTVAPGASDPPVVNHSDIAVSFSFRCTTDEGLSSIVQTLAMHRLSALFLFSPADLVVRDDDVRDLLARGHQVGLLLDPEQAAEQFAEGNRLLSHIARLRTRVVASSAGALPQGDWTLFSDNVGNPLSAATTPGGLARLTLSALESRRSVGRVLLDDSATTAGALPRIFVGLTDGKYTLRPTSELTLDVPTRNQ